MTINNTPDAPITEPMTVPLAAPQPPIPVPPAGNAGPSWRQPAQTFPSKLKGSRLGLPDTVSVGLLAWAAVLGVIGLLLIIVPMVGTGNLRVVLTVLLFVAGFSLLGLAVWFARGTDGIARTETAGQSASSADSNSSSNSGSSSI